MPTEIGANSLICIAGLPSSGKTTVATRLLARLGESATLADSDTLWCAMLGRDGNQPLGPCDINVEMGIRVEQALHEKTMSLLAEGKTVIVPTAFLQPTMRQNFESLAEKMGVPLYCFWLMIPTEMAIQRATQRQLNWDRGVREPNNMSVMDAHLGDPDLVQAEVAPNWIRIDSSHPRESVLEAICKSLPFLQTKTSMPTDDLRGILSGLPGNALAGDVRIELTA